MEKNKTIPGTSEEKKPFLSTHKHNYINISELIMFSLFQHNTPVNSAFSNDTV